MKFNLLMMMLVCIGLGLSPGFAASFECPEHYTPYTASAAPIGAPEANPPTAGVYLMTCNTAGSLDLNDIGHLITRGHIAAHPDYVLDSYLLGYPSGATGSMLVYEQSYSIHTIAYTNTTAGGDINTSAPAPDLMTASTFDDNHVIRTDVDLGTCYNWPIASSGPGNLHRRLEAFPHGQFGSLHPAA